MKALIDYYLVKIDKEFEDSTNSGLFIDTTYQPLRRKRLYGTIISCPTRFSNDTYYVEDVKDVSPANAKLYQTHIPYSAIPMELCEGDVVYFYYMANDRNETHLGDNIIAVHIRNIICTKEFKMIGSHVLMHPYYGEGVTRVYNNNVPMFVRKVGLLELPVGDYHKNIAHIAHIGSPLLCCENIASVGDKVLYRLASEVDITIEGQEFITVRQHELLAIL